MHVDHSADAHRIHSKSPSSWPIQICAAGGDVFAAATSSRTTDEAGSPRNRRSIEATRCGCCDGIKPFMYGNARCRKDDGIDDNQLHAWSHAIECQNKRGIPEPAEPSMKVALWSAVRRGLQVNATLKSSAGQKE